MRGSPPSEDRQKVVCPCLNRGETEGRFAPRFRGAERECDAVMWELAVAGTDARAASFPAVCGVGPNGARAARFPGPGPFADGAILVRCRRLSRPVSSARGLRVPAPQP